MFIRVFLCLALVAASAAAQAVESEGRVVAVTLYRGQAQVQRQIEVDGPAGPIELVVANLPEQFSQGSLFAEGGPQLDVRAVRFRERAVGQEPREEVRALETQIAETQQQILLNQKMTELQTRQSKYLDGLDAFAAPTAKKELTEGTLDADALQKVTEFSFTQRKQILEQEVQLTLELSQLQETLASQQRQLAEITNGSLRSVREAVVFLEKRAAGSQSLRLNYLVDGCGWSPSYTVRAIADGAEDVRLECNALIQQISGEDWKDVALTLSTASPALSAAGPGLAPFEVSLVAQPGQGKVAVQTDVGMQLKQIFSQQQEALALNRQAYSTRDNFDSAWAVNGSANQLQALELFCDVDQFNEAQLSASEGPTLSYTLDMPVSLATRRDQQIVRIAQCELPSRFYHVATPVLSQFVYREAEVDNSGEFDLLGGVVNVYLDDRFVGRTELPTVARGQTFVIGFGADPQLRTRRELAKRTDDVQGGNRELGFTYRLQLENFKGQAAKVRLLDRLPVSSNNGQVRVSLLESGADLSDDKVYQRIERPKGLLRWDVEVPAGAVGDTGMAVSYEYTVEYDKQYVLAAANQTIDQQQQDFEQLLRSRQKR